MPQSYRDMFAGSRLHRGDQLTTRFSGIPRKPLMRPPLTLANPKHVYFALCLERFCHAERLSRRDPIRSFSPSCPGGSNQIRRQQSRPWLSGRDQRRPCWIVSLGPQCSHRIHGDCSRGGNCACGCSHRQQQRCHREIREVIRLFESSRLGRNYASCCAIPLPRG